MTCGGRSLLINILNYGPVSAQEHYTISRPFDKHVSVVARSCNYHAQAIRHTRHMLIMDLAQTLACSLILSSIDYCNAVLHGAPSTSCSGYRTMPRGSFTKLQDDHTHSRRWKNCIGCRLNSASPTSWPCWRSRYAIRQHRRISVGTSKHVAALGHCGHQLFRFSKCRSDEPVSENDPQLRSACNLELSASCYHESWHSLCF